MEEKSPLETGYVAREPLSKEEVVRQVIELEKISNEFVIEQTPEFIQNLYEKNLLRFETNGEGKILATLYIQPLNNSLVIDDSNQVFRIGGFSSSFSEGSERASAKLLRKLKNEVLEKNMTVITKTNNQVVAKYLKKIGMEELTLEEFEKKYLELFKIYPKASPEDEKEHPDKKFYVHQALSTH